MNTLEDDLRTVLHAQATAMPVPTPILDRTVAHLTTPSAPRDRRWVLPAAAVVLVALGGVALAQRHTTPDMPIDPATEQPAGRDGAPFVFDMPTVRLTAQHIEVTVGGKALVPSDASVRSDPGNGAFTSLELTWAEDAVEQRIFVDFASDGSTWWAESIRTYDGNTPGDWIASPPGERYFTSPLGTAWSGDLELPNLRITGMTVEAFRRPAACDVAVGPIAVVSAFPTIDGFAVDGGGFRARVDLIDTATCTAIDATPFTFTATVDDTSVATVVSAGPSSNAVAPTATAVVDGSVVGSHTGSVAPSTVPFGSIDLAMVAAGQTTLRVTVTDSSGALVGTVVVPVVVTTVQGAGPATPSADQPLPPVTMAP